MLFWRATRSARAVSSPPRSSMGRRAGSRRAVGAFERLPGARRLSTRARWRVLRLRLSPTRLHHQGWSSCRPALVACLDDPRRWRIRWRAEAYRRRRSRASPLPARRPGHRAAPRHHRRRLGGVSGDAGGHLPSAVSTRWRGAGASATVLITFDLVSRRAYDDVGGRVARTSVSTTRAAVRRTRAALVLPPPRRAFGEPLRRSLVLLTYLLSRFAEPRHGQCSVATAVTAVPGYPIAGGGDAPAPPRQLADVRALATARGDLLPSPTGLPVAFNLQRTPMGSSRAVAT